MIRRTLNTIKLLNYRASNLNSLPKLAYISYQGYANLGDEAIHNATRALFAGNSLIEYKSESEEGIASKFGLSGKNYYVGALLSGGTTICEPWRNYVQRALAQGLPISTFGSGVGSPDVHFQEPHSIESWKPLLRDFSLIGVRGPLSIARLTELGIDNAELIGDAAFLFTPDVLPPLPTVRRFAISNHLSPSVNYPAGEYEILKSLPVAMKLLIERGWEPVPIVMNPRDGEATKELLTSISQDHLEIHQPATAEQFFRDISDCSFVISTRLHTSILASCFGIAPMMLSTLDKCNDFMLSINLPEYALDCYKSTQSEFTELALRIADEASTKRVAIHAQCIDYRQRIRNYGERVKQTFAK